MRFATRCLPMIGLVLLAGCPGDPTYVLTRFERGPQLTGDVARLELTLQLDGRTDDATIEDDEGAPLVLPLTRALQIVAGSGALLVTARALSAASTELAAGSGQVDVGPGEIAGLTLVLGGGTASLDLGEDLIVPDLGAPDDLAVALDLPPPPVLVVTAPPDPLYEMSTYVWTIAATESGAAIPPVVSFDPTTLAPGMIPASTGPGGATLSFAPSFRQAGTYSVKVIATSTAQPNLQTTELIAITIGNTVDPIGNFYDAQDAAWFESAATSLPVFAVGDFNGDGFDDLVHVVRNRRVIGTDLQQDYQSALRFYVLLGSALGLPVAPSDASATVPASAQIRRIAHTEGRLDDGFNSLGLEVFPALYDYQDRYVAAARLFPADAADTGREIVFLDRNHLYDQGGRFFRSQLFVVPSNATPSTTVVPLLASDNLPRTDNVGSTLLAGDLEGDGIDELLYDATITDTTTSRRLALWQSSATEPTALDPIAIASFTVCTGSTQPQYLGFGNVRMAAGSELAISACQNTLAGNAISALDATGFQETMFLPPQAVDTSNGPSTPFGLCDLDHDGFDDLYRLDNRQFPVAIEVYLNTTMSPPYPVDAKQALDEKQAKRLDLGATTVGSWQYAGCLRKATGDELWVARGFNYEDTRYEVVPLVLAAGKLQKGTPYTSGFMTWPGELTSRPWFNRPKGSGDFNGDGKTDVITTASGQAGRSYWNVVYGR